jgi:hypothetical protein
MYRYFLEHVPAALLEKSKTNKPGVAFVGKIVEWNKQ